ncbi:MAG: hypothetical protein ACYDEH_00930 [Acidimicrobiales bacterium]
MGRRTGADHDDRSVVGLLALTQGLFFASLGLCIAINHSVTASKDGISFYGVDPNTIVLVIVGYAAASIGIYSASSWLRDAGAPATAVRGARAVAIGLPLLLATPYNQGTVWNWSHMTVGVVMALAQGAATISLVRRRGGAGSWVVISVQLAGGLLAAASLPNWSFPWLLPGETVYELAYGASLFLWIDELGGRLSRRERVSRANA